MKKIYLGGPLDDATPEQISVWRNQIKEVFPWNYEQFLDIFPGYRVEYAFLDPSHRIFTQVELNDHTVIKEIVTLDKVDIASSDIILANLQLLDKVRCVGTIMEIIYAWQLGKYVIVIMDRITPVSPWIQYHCHKIVYSVDEAIQYLKEMK